MSVVLVLESEPPSGPAPDRSQCLAAAERVMAMTHVPPRPHVTVIGRHTLPFVIALMDRGCASVRSLRPDAPMPDCEVENLVWIVDVANEAELVAALDAARRRTGCRGRVVVEGGGCLSCVLVERHARAMKLEVISFDRLARRVVLAARPLVAMAA